jgi:hypothetical protein
MTLFMNRHLVPAMLALLIFMVGLAISERALVWWQGFGPAIEWHGVEVITETVQPGGVLEMVYTAEVHRSCPADIRSFLVAPDGTVPVRYPTVAGGYSRPSDGPVQIRVSVTIPTAADTGLAPFNSGIYVYRTNVTRYCPGGVEDDAAVPDAPFRLEVPE